MTDEELKTWMADSSTSRLRIVEVDGKQVGFVYLYNDSGTDSDFQSRTDSIRNKLTLPPELPFWELNFWLEEVSNTQAMVAVGKVLGQFSSTFDEGIMPIVMFADAADVFGDAPVSFAPEAINAAETNFQRFRHF